MHKILFLTFIIFLVQPVWALGYSEHIDYLSKIIPPVSISGIDFADIDLSSHPDLKLWLKDADAKLNPSELGTYDADLLLNINSEGYIKSISIADLREDNLSKFKVFIAKLQTIQFKSLASEINSNTVFEFDASTLYFKRHPSYIAGVSFTETLEPDLEPELAAILNYCQANPELKLTLLEPSYVDYPHIGEKLIFQIEGSKYKGLKLDARVIDVDDKAMLVRLNRLNDKLINLVFKINRPSKNSHSTLATVINSGLGSAAGAGITASVATNGILPGVFALTNMAGTLMKEREELLSFNIIRGDEVILIKDSVKENK